METSTPETSEKTRKGGATTEQEMEGHVKGTCDVVLQIGFLIFPTWAESPKRSLSPSDQVQSPGTGLIFEPLFFFKSGEDVFLPFSNPAFFGPANPR